MNELSAILKGKNGIKIRNHSSINIIFKTGNSKYCWKNFTSKVRYRI